MKRSGFSEEQIIGILKENEASISAKELCRRHGMSDPSFYKWKAKFGGMGVSEAAVCGIWKLKKLVADLSLDKMALEDVPEKI
ncbi:transposase [Roseibium sp.]|uniref:transposase n=1 Tax=Roseibium sp. TaxID=1936156 RepID=UPI003B50840E